MEILNSISNGSLMEAFQKLKRYDDSNEKNSNPRLELQFCMFAYAQIKKKKGYNRRLGKIFEKALECTAGCSWNMIPEKILSVQELSFILDDAYYNRKPERIKIYEQVVEYIKRPYFDVFSRAMIIRRQLYIYAVKYSESRVNRTGRLMRECLNCALRQKIF